MFTFVLDLVLTEFSCIYSAAVVKLKTLTSLLAADEQLSNKTVENMRTMQKVLVYIVTIISNFMDLEPTTTRISQLLKSSKHTLSRDYLSIVTPNTSKNMVSDKNWQKKAIVSVMEAGGVNWLVGNVYLFNAYDFQVILKHGPSPIYLMFFADCFKCIASFLETYPSISFIKHIGIWRSLYEHTLTLNLFAMYYELLKNQCCI